LKLWLAKVKEVKKTAKLKKKEVVIKSVNVAKRQK